VTSTEEVGRGNEILLQANRDLNNLLANINVSIVLLAPNLTIRRYTPPAEKTLRLRASRIGKPIEAVGLSLRLPDLKQRLLNVIKTRRAQELEVQDSRGREYYLFLRPYRAERRKTDDVAGKSLGVVMVLVDIHDKRLSEKALLRIASLVRDSNDAVIIRDLKGRLIAWNRGARKMYGYTETEALAMSVGRLKSAGVHIPAKDLLRMSAPGKGEPTEITRRAKSGLTLDVLITVTALRDDKGRAVEFLTTERDISLLKVAARELRRLHVRVVSLQETERKRVARELHDGVGQILSGVKFRLESMSHTAKLSAGRAAAEILKLSGLLDHAISELRRVSQNLMPSELEDLGLVPALRTLCREFKSRARVDVTLRTRDVPEGIAPDLALAFFRIAQEALNNAGKHSRAKSITVTLSRKGSELALSVSDDGIGFKTRRDKRRPRKGIGLGNIRERSHSVGGTMEIVSKSGIGTTVSVRAPLARPEESSL